MAAILLKVFQLTKREYFADFFITPPLTLALMGYSLLHSFGPLWLPGFVLGLLAWTFYEYATHRWVLHELQVFRAVHWLHHRNQKEYIAVHPLVTVAIYAAMWILFGPRSSAFALGFSVGYVLYSFEHTAFHYADIRKGNPLYGAKLRHVAHHRFHTVNYGVTTGVWDLLFRSENISTPIK
jgi:sterol desaturase/sphingolipid hydroxylase (fatty acid hydroxylase superfamily)